MKKLLLILLSTLLVVSFCSCKENIDLKTGVTYSAYVLEEEGKKESYASFYMTSNKKTEGVWEYEIKGDVLEIVEANEENKEIKDGEANYKTLIVKAKEAGEAEIIFKMDSREIGYTITIGKAANDFLEMIVFENGAE